MAHNNRYSRFIPDFKATIFNRSQLHMQISVTKICYISLKKVTLLTLYLYKEFAIYLITLCALNSILFHVNITMLKTLIWLPDICFPFFYFFNVSLSLSFWFFYFRSSQSWGCVSITWRVFKPDSWTPLWLSRSGVRFKTIHF